MTDQGTDPTYQAPPDQGAPDLTGRTVLVAGGTGAVGSGIVGVLRHAGATVVVPTRRPDAARELLGDEVVVVEGSLGDPAAAAAVRDAVAAAGVQPTDVVDAVGSWWEGPPVGQLPDGAWADVGTERLATHLHLADALLPVLVRADRPTLTALAGATAVEPSTGSGLVSVAGAAQVMLGRVIAAQQGDDGVAATTLVIGTPILTREQPGGDASWVSAEAIGRLCAAIAAGARLAPVVELGDAAGARAAIAAAQAAAR